MNNSIGSLSTMYNIYPTTDNSWSMSDDLKFALFSEIIASNQENVYARIKDNTYNTIYYNLHNTIHYDNDNTQYSYSKGKLSTVNNVSAIGINIEVKV